MNGRLRTALSVANVGLVGPGIVGFALLAGAARGDHLWWDGPGATWENAANWSTVSSATTPNPVAAAGGTDTAVYSVDSYTLSNTRRLVTLAADRSVGSMILRNMGTTVGGGGIGLEPAATGARTLTLGADGITLAVGGNLEIRGTSSGDFTLALGADQTWRNFEGGGYVNIASLAPGNTALDLAGHALTLAGGNLVTFSATSPSGRIVDNTGGGGIILLSDGRLRLYNQLSSIHADRIEDTIGITSSGGRIESNHHSNTASGLSETVGELTLAKGTTRYGSRRNAATANYTVFTFGGLSRTSDTAMFMLDGTFENGGYYGVTTDTRNRVIVTGQATTDFIGPWAVYYQTADQYSGFLAYSTDVYLGFERGLYSNSGSVLTATTSDAAGIYKFENNITATANLVVRALCVTTGNSRSVTLNAYNLTIASGGLLFGAGGSYSIIGTTGKVTAGTTSGTHYLYATSSNPKTVNKDTIAAELADNDAGGTVGLVKSGTGTLTLTKTNTYTGDTVVNEGTVDLSAAGSIASTPSIELLYGASLTVSSQTTTWSLGAAQTLCGNGLVAGSFSVAGTIAPGASTGTLTVTGNVAFVAGSVLEIEARNSRLGGDKADAGYDRLVVNGAVTPGGVATLDVEVLPGESLAEEDLLFVVANDGTDVVSGLFKSPAGSVLAQGVSFAAGGKWFQVSYRGDLATGEFDAGSAGNDVVLKVVAPSSSGTVILVM